MQQALTAIKNRVFCWLWLGMVGAGFNPMQSDGLAPLVGKGRLG